MDIKDYINHRNIKSLYHFTNLDNLKNILKYGLLSREKLEENKYQYDCNDELRLENQLKSICVSISFPNYKMFYKYRIERPHVTWCVLELNPEILYKKQCLFCITNAASRCETVRKNEDRKGVDGLIQLFYDDEHREKVGLKREYPTNPQAEVLILDNIEPSYIKNIHFDVRKVYFPIGEYPQYGFLYSPELFKYREDWNIW